VAAGTGTRLETDRAISAPVKGTPLSEAEAALLAMVEAGVGAVPLPGLAWPDVNHPSLTFRKPTVVALRSIDGGLPTTVARSP
jgi:hypothetical protein